MIEKLRKVCSRCSKEIFEDVEFCPYCGEPLSEDKVMDFYVKQKLTITQQDIDDIVCSALEGGSTHWCSGVDVVGEYLGEYASDQISRGGTLIFHVLEGDKDVKLTLTKFLEGLQAYIASECKYDLITKGAIDTYKVHADDADGVIQYALFGDIIYG